MGRYLRHCSTRRDRRLTVCGEPGYRLDNLVGCLIRIVVLPHAKHSPASLTKSSVCISITQLIGKDLFLPEPGGLAGRWSVVLRTSMPEASVHEHCQLHFGEGEISRSPHTLDRLIVDAVPQTACVCGRPQCKLRPGVPMSIGSHYRSRTVTRRPRLLRLSSHCCPRTWPGANPPAAPWTMLEPGSRPGWSPRPRRCSARAFCRR